MSMFHHRGVIEGLFSKNLLLLQGNFVKPNVEQFKILTLHIVKPFKEINYVFGGSPL